MSTVVVSTSIQRLVEYIFYSFVCFNIDDERNQNNLEKFEKIRKNSKPFVKKKKIRKNSPFFEGKLKQILKVGRNGQKSCDVVGE